MTLGWGTFYEVPMTATFAPGPMKSGRPRAKANENKPRFWETRLYALIFKKVPKFVTLDSWGQGRLDLLHIAQATGFHPYTVNKWFTNDKLSPKGAGALIRESGGALTAEDVAPHLLD